MSTEKYPAFPKIPRLHREVVLTEKIDGTNGLISIVEAPYGVAAGEVSEDGYYVVDDRIGAIKAGSRTRWISPEQDNFGFAKWVRENAEELVLRLGSGNHYGEWWGSGIQRGYGQPNGWRNFSLFNTGRWDADEVSGFNIDGLGVVPVLWSGDASHLNEMIRATTLDLGYFGSRAAPEFMKPEGVIVYHVAGGHTYKVLLENDNQPKGNAA